MSVKSTSCHMHPLPTTVDAISPAIAWMFPLGPFLLMAAKAQLHIHTMHTNARTVLSEDQQSYGWVICKGELSTCMCDGYTYSAKYTLLSSDTLASHPSGRRVMSSPASPHTRQSWSAMSERLWAELNRRMR